MGTNHTGGASRRAGPLLFVGVALAFLCSASLALGQTKTTTANAEAQFRQLVSTFKEKAAELAGQAGGQIAAKIRALTTLFEILQGAGSEWSDALWGRVVELANQTGVALDEMVPTVSGRVVDERGAPVSGALILTLPPAYNMGSGGAAVPTTAATGNGDFEAAGVLASKFGVAGGNFIPVPRALVPLEYRATFNQGGSYCVPLAPNLVSEIASLTLMVLSAPGTQLETSRQMQVIVLPLLPGYTFAPLAKAVLIKQDGTFRVDNLSSPSEILTVTTQGSGTSLQSR